MQARLTEVAWVVRPDAPADVSALLTGSGYPSLLAQLLYNRGISTPDQARSFLSHEPVSHDPWALPGMESAVDRLTVALERKERIAVFGDFDVDGITATALLARALKPLGCQILPYIPHRVEEGHGLSLHAVQVLAREGVDLLITVDCGVTSHEEVRAATRAGIDTIITDHHLAPDGGPDALAVVDPRLSGSHYPFPYLTGAGLAWKLAQAVYTSLDRADEFHDQPLLSLAALGTVADVAPLVDENRSIVRDGLKELGQRPSTGLHALMRSARQDGHPPDTETVGWYLAPRLNASGRVAHADTSYRLLVTDSPEEAATLVGVLETQNRQRQELTAAAHEKTKGLVELEPLVMVCDASFLPGIIGLVASRLVDEHGRPAVVVSIGEEISRGSCRSVSGFDIGSALHEVATSMDGFIAFGGHPQAAGFTIATGSVPELRRRLVAKAREAMGEEVAPRRLDVDMELPLGSLPRDIYRVVGELAPFGEGNPEPVFLSRGVQVAGVRPFGADGAHISLKLRNGGVTWNAVAFRQGKKLPAGARLVDVVYTVGIDRWNGQETLRLGVLDIRASG